jgi:hypothetical protein
MDRVLQFRAWDYLNKSFVYWQIYEDNPTLLSNNTKQPQQFTGLWDKEKNNIYEGDIIFCVDDMAFYEVLFYKGMFVIKTDENEYSPLIDYVEDSVVYSHIYKNNIQELTEKFRAEM